MKFPDKRIDFSGPPRSRSFTGFRSWLQTSCIPLWRPLHPAGIPKPQAPKPDQSPTASCSHQEGCSAVDSSPLWNIRKWASGHPCKGGCQRRTACKQCQLQRKADSHQRAHNVKITKGDYHLLSRKQQVILVRLRTGHNRLNRNMHRKLKLAPSPTWPCGQEEQTAEHVLQRCPLHKATREDVWPVSTSLATKLYGCKQELEKTTSFISRAALIV